MEKKNENGKVQLKGQSQSGNPDGRIRADIYHHGRRTVFLQ